MIKEGLANDLVGKHQLFINYIANLSENDFLYSPEGKWSGGQQLDHIFRSVQPVALALKLPKFMLRIMFGKTNRPSRTYEALVEKYHFKLENGGAASGRFMPGKVTLQQRQKLSEKITKSISSLVMEMESYSEKELDNIILPHPLLGKLTLREMIYFTIYHVEHHHNLTEKNIAGQSR